ncbi:NmrA/HSCARG family protein [Nucisporomicrobium flavum]|uniref:NmrA/HSCARG family protein n=1 Tax=Nucisporomicrobium flavum TaxID=2785915 RepID=UPI0018F63741|nr:NmrA/HSCARG family protein [Nucisporomicrobium flavum]
MSVLVVGGTGQQGGATARALLAAGTPVRALVRDPGSAKAAALREAGAELVKGDLGVPETLAAAVAGVRGVFSVQTPDIADPESDSERVHGRNLIEAARAAGVEQFVHTSVSSAGEFHRTMPGWAEGRWNRQYWDSKADIDDWVRAAGFRSWTVLKPATFMDNLLGWSPMFGDWSDGTIVTSLAADTRIALIAVDDIGTAAAAAFTDRERFHGRDVQLAGDLLTMTEIAAVLSDVLGRRVEAPVLTAAEAVQRGMHPAMVSMMEWSNEVGNPARPEHNRELGLPTTDFRTWAARAFG